MLNSDVLQPLGCLPYLESLQVHSFMDSDISIVDLAISTGAFPSLRHLKLDSVSGSIISKLWQAAPLVQDLVFVDVEFMEDSVKAINHLI